MSRFVVDAPVNTSLGRLVLVVSTPYTALFVKDKDSAGLEYA